MKSHGKNTIVVGFWVLVSGVSVAQGSRGHVIFEHLRTCLLKTGPKLGQHGQNLMAESNKTTFSHVFKHWVLVFHTDLQFGLYRFKTSQFWLKLTNFNQIAFHFQIVMKNSYSVPKKLRKLVFFGLLGHLIEYWPFGSKIGLVLANTSQFWPCEVQISNFYEKSIFSAQKPMEKWSCLTL